MFDTHALFEPEDDDHHAANGEDAPKFADPADRKLMNEVR